MMDDEDNERETKCQNKFESAPPKLSTTTFSDIAIKYLASKDRFFPKLSNFLLGTAIALVLSIAIGYSSSYHKSCYNNGPQNQVEIKKYLVYSRNSENGFLQNIFNVLQRLGYKNTSDASEWDLLWAHDYPFRIFQLYKLKPHQKVNKMPGSGYITNKVDLATSDLKYIPKAFRLPEDKEKLLEYVQQQDSELEFVQKNNQHRHIQIRDIYSIDLDANGTFVQEYVGRPLLVSGHKFDIGIYTVITSIDPLRVYIYNADALLRFCPHKYYPFDKNDIDKYVVGDDYLPIWKVSDLANYYSNLGFGMKESLNTYLRSKGKDPNTIWEQIEDAIRIVCLSKEPKIASVMKRYNSSRRNFFELIRFDFVVDEDLNVSLMEANMSPNLSSSHFPENRLLFEQVIYNLFGLVGVSERVRQNLASRSDWETKMQVDDKNIAVLADECSHPLCQEGCTSPMCQLCRHCLTPEMKVVFTSSYLEHRNKGDFKRVFPPMMNARYSLDNIEEYSVENQLLYRWFRGKCIIDATWCL